LFIDGTKFLDNAHNCVEQIHGPDPKGVTLNLRVWTNIIKDETYIEKWVSISDLNGICSVAGKEFWLTSLD